MLVRSEADSDLAAIPALVTEAFRGAPHTGGNEAAIVEGLRAAGALAVSLVAEDAGRIVGQVAFSPVTVTDGATGWFGLGPVAVAPERQRQGIGRALIEAGLGQLRAAGAKGCVVLGDPAYYARFGFRVDGRLTFADAPPEYFMALRLGDDRAAGAVAYHAAFYP